MGTSREEGRDQDISEGINPIGKRVSGFGNVYEKERKNDISKSQGLIVRQDFDQNTSRQTWDTTHHRILRKTVTSGNRSFILYIIIVVVLYNVKGTRIVCVSYSE